MKEAGGIIALIAGIFGVTGAATTLFVGGGGGAFNVEGAGTVIGLGWGGMLFSFLTIIFGAIAIGAEGKVPGILLIISSILGGNFGLHACGTLYGFRPLWGHSPQYSGRRKFRRR